MGPAWCRCFYLDPALKHYRCLTVWSSVTNSVRITDTLAWFLDNLQLPSPSVHDLLLAAIHDLTTALHTVTRAHPDFHHQRQLSNIPTITQQLLDIAALYTPPPVDSTVPTIENIDTPDAAEQRVQIPSAPASTAISGLPVPSHPSVLTTPPTEQRVPGAEVTTAPSAVPDTSKVDALPNIPLLPSQHPRTVPQPPSSPITRQHAARQRAHAVPSHRW